MSRRRVSNLVSRSLLPLICLVTLFSASALTQTTDVWLGGTGNWSNPLKWSAGVPTASSNVFIDNGNGTASAVTVDVGSAACNNLTVDSDDSLTIPSGSVLTVNGTSIVNNGKINITDYPSNAVLNIAAGRNVMLSGGGTVTLTDTLLTEGAILSGGSNSTLTNTSAIQGGGEIGGGGLALVNLANGVINANQSRPGELLLDAPHGATNQGLMEATSTGTLGLSTMVNNSAGTITASGSFSFVVNHGVIQGGTVSTTNSGAMDNIKPGVLEAVNGGVLTLSGVSNYSKIESLGSGSKVFVPGAISNFVGTFSVGCGTLFQITGTFANFGNTTLQGGNYSICGKFQFPGANIVTNMANISLIGPSSAIVDQANNDGLRNLASTTFKSRLSLSSGKNLTTPGGYSNAGTLAVLGSNTKFNVSGAYTQTIQSGEPAGSTRVDGTLSASSGTTIQGGNVFGKGTLVSTVASSGSMIAGDTATSPGKLSMSTYTQTSGGLLNIPIGGLNVGTQYGQLAVANGASLNGSLSVKLINGFVPVIGDTFTILTASAVTGQFATVNGLSINSSEHFAVTYGGTSVTLTVEAGP